MNPDSRRIGPLRCLSACKPRVQRAPLSFFYCSHCKSIFRSWTQPDFHHLQCCGSPLKPIQPQPLLAPFEDISLTYSIEGGLNENCIKVFWQGQTPCWLYLETYTGGQQIWLDEKKRPPAVFALAGEDAYAYCDNDPCEKCSFRCKNGFVLYAFYTELGLFSIPLNQIAATSGSPVSRTSVR